MYCQYQSWSFWSNLKLTNKFTVHTFKYEHLDIFLSLKNFPRVFNFQNNVFKF